MTWPFVVASLALLNLWTFASFGLDKSHARQGRRRIPERDLLTLAMLGGTPGAFLGRHVFRHKTRKQPFSTHLMLIAAIQAGGGIGLGLASI